MIISFANHNFLLHFLKRIWSRNKNQLSQCLLGKTEESPQRWILELPEAGSATLYEEELERTKGQIETTRPRLVQSSSIEDLWRGIRLRTSQSSRFYSAQVLVFPNDEAGYDLNRLIDLISLNSNLNLKIVQLRLEEDSKIVSAIQVNHEDGMSWDPVKVLPGHVQSYTARPYRPDIFLPVGYDHPLLSNFQFLIPETKDDRLTILRQESESQGSWSPKVVQPIDTIDVLEFLAIEDFNRQEEMPVLDGAKEVSLSVSLVRASHRTMTAFDSRTAIYQFESREGQLSDQFLSILDYAEAGIAHYTYYSSFSDEDRWGLAKHYVRIDHALEVDGIAPEFSLATYICPEVFRSRGLNIYLSRADRFSPNLELLLGQDETSNNFVKTLVTALGLDDVDYDAALVERGRTPNEPKVTLLKNGRPLKDILRPVMENWHPYIAKVSFDQEKEVAYEGATEIWEESIDRANSLADGVREEITAWMTEVGLSCNQAELTLPEAKSNCDSAEAFVQKSEARLLSAANSWTQFTTTVVSMEKELTALPKMWCAELDSEKDTLQALIKERTTSALDAQKEAELRLIDVDRALDETKTQVAKLHKIAESVEKRGEGITSTAKKREAFSKKANDKLTQLEGQLEKEQKRHDEALAAAEGRKLDLNKERSVLARAEESLRQLLKANTIESERQDQQRQRIQKRMAGAKAEAAALIHSREKRIPALEAALKKAQERLASLLAEGIEHQLETVTKSEKMAQKELAEMLSRKAKLEREQAKLRELTDKIESQLAQVNGLEDKLSRVKSLLADPDLSSAHLRSLRNKGLIGLWTYGAKRIGNLFRKKKK